MLNSKKGIGIDDATHMVIFIIIAALAIIFFKIYEQSKTSQLSNDIQKQKDIAEGHEMLLEYIAKTDEYGNSKADYLSQYYNNKDYEKIREDVAEHFSKKLSRLPAWKIDFIDDNEQKGMQQIIPSIESGSGYYYRVASSEVPIAGAEPKYLLINLFFGKGGPGSELR